MTRLKSGKLLGLNIALCETMKRVVWILVLVLVAACHQSTSLEDGGVPDSGNPDDGILDSGIPDNALDEGSADANQPDRIVLPPPMGCKLVEYDVPITLVEGESYCFPDGWSFQAEVSNELCPCDADCFWEGEVAVNSKWLSRGVELSRRTGSSNNTPNLGLPNGSQLSIQSYDTDNCMYEVSNVEFLVTSPQIRCLPVQYGIPFDVEEGQTYCFEDAQLMVSRVANELCGCEEICGWEGEIAVYGVWKEGGTEQEVRVGAVSRPLPQTMIPRWTEIEAEVTPCPEQELIGVRMRVDAIENEDQ